MIRLFSLILSLFINVNGRLVSHKRSHNSQGHAVETNTPTSAVEPNLILIYGDPGKSPIDCYNTNVAELTYYTNENISTLQRGLDTHDHDSIQLLFPNIYKALVNKTYKPEHLWLREKLQRYTNDLSLLKDDEAAHFIQNILELTASVKPSGSEMKVERLRRLKADMITVTKCVDDDELDKRLLELSELIPCVESYKLDGERENHHDPTFLSLNNLFGTKADDEFHPLKGSTRDAGISDEHFKSQWYIGGPPEQPYGANILRAWNYMLGRDEEASFEGIESKVFGDTMDIVVVDVGCGANGDILYNASHPFCDEEYETDGKDGSLRGTNEEMINNHDDFKHGEYCNGHHLPNMGLPSRESYHKDPLHHGVATNSIIGAGWNDVIGIAGLCPFCRVKCIKIGSGVKDNVKLSMAGVFRSLEFLHTFKDVYKISNHSYGGFLLEAAEILGHQNLYHSDHLVVTAAGNYSCDIDPLAEAFGAFSEKGISMKGSVPKENKCKADKDVAATAPMMPASISHPNKIDVGASTIAGGLSGFSNYGLKSIGLFAPGENIVSLLSEDDNSKTGEEVIFQHGTSFSAPIVTACAALLQRHMENLCHTPTPAEIIDVLLMNVSGNGALKGKAVAGGIVDLLAAMKSVENVCNL